jgi:hypothetical protein
MIDRDAIAAYRAKFPDAVPTLIGLPEDTHDAASKLLADATEAYTDATFYAALGLDPLPDDPDMTI